MLLTLPPSSPSSYNKFDLIQKKMSNNNTSNNNTARNTSQDINTSSPSNPRRFVQQQPAQQQQQQQLTPSQLQHRQEQLMTAAMLERSAFHEGAGAGNPLFAPSLGERRASLLAAQQWQQQQQQQHQQLMQFQLQRQQAAAAAEHAAQQQEQLEINSLLRQRRQIDEMLLNSMSQSRRLSMPGMDSFPSAGAASASSFLPPGSAATSIPMSMGTASAMFGSRAAAAVGAPSPTAATSSFNISTNTNPSSAFLGGADSDLLAGKIAGGPAHLFPDQRSFSDPLFMSAAMAANQNSSSGSGRSRLHPLQAQASAAQDHQDTEHPEEEEELEEDDETYFDDAGTDEVDRDFKRSQENFPLKLYRILWEVTHKQGRGDIMSFFPHGRAFAVHKPKEFLAEVMPKYFATGRMNTFLKQLNLYGFRRITEGKDKGGYFHPKFILGKRHLCKQIRRKKTDWKAPAGGKAAGAATGASKKEATVKSSASTTSTDQYVETLKLDMKKQRQESKSRTPSPPSPRPSGANSPSSHPKMRWKRTQQG